MTEILLNFEEKRPWRRIFSIIYFLFFPTMLRMMLSRKWYNPMILPPLDDDDNGWRLWSLMSVRPSLPLLDCWIAVCLFSWLADTGPADTSEWVFWPSYIRLAFFCWFLLPDSLVLLFGCGITSIRCLIFSFFISHINII